MNTTLQNIIENTQELILCDSRGVYIPMQAVESVKVIAAQLSPWERKQLLDPEKEGYWEAWENVLNREYSHENKCIRFEQDGDLFVIFSEEREKAFCAWEKENPELDLVTELEKLI